MTPLEWFGLVAGIGMAAALLMMAWQGLQGGGLRSEQVVDVVCPEKHLDVECRVQRDVRIGQWRQVSACSAFEDPEDVTCGRECRHRVNLGTIVPRIHAA